MLERREGSVQLRTLIPDTFIEFPIVEVEAIGDIIFPYIGKIPYYITMGFYPNNTEFHETNVVTYDHILEHVLYNLAFRPGRTFFVNGNCFNLGYYTDAQVKEAQDIAYPKAVKMLAKKNLVSSAPYT